MQTATITVAHKNPPSPGKNGGMRPANIKTKDGVYFQYAKGVSPDSFQQGGQYQIGYEVQERNGYTNNVIKQILETQSRPIQAPPKPQAKELQREKSPKENENIFVNGKLSAAITAGAVEFQEDALVAAGKLLQRVYARLYKPVNIQQTEIEMDDEIPGFGQ